MERLPETEDQKHYRRETLPETESLLELSSPQQSQPLRKESIETEIEDFPEGGTRAWAAVAGGGPSMRSVSTKTIIREDSPSKIAWIGSIQLFLIFFFGLPIGKLFDDGYFHHLVGFGSAIYIFSYFMLSLAQPHNYYQVFLAQGVGVGIGMGLIYVPSLTLAFHYFKRRRALAVGLSSTGAACGAIIQTIGLNHLINGKVGFAWGIRIFGFIFLILAIIGNLLMKPRLPPKRLRPGPQPKPDVKKIVTNIPLLLGILGTSLFLFSAFFPFFYTQLFAILHGISTNLAFYSITILNAMTIAGRIVAGLMADRYGYCLKLVVLLSTILMGSTTFVMIKATTVHGLIAFTILYGFFSGAYTALAASSISAYVDNPNEMGVALGYTMFIESFFVLVAQPVFGAIVDAPRYKWNNAIIAAAVIVYGGVALLLISRMLLAKHKKTWKF
ncbi:hypothetical protein Clacol_003103 [Clathrus columnatus]|uniref:Major facilitator superfamily (MFS) profile domain-containing protein n=1 Tax=Clathrus columnatus TaxID=1419009 RepID=A0AAV5A5X7_9AGAM|nr:hypothetical protein Clacol_003103 [Clathrus columnatus]